MCLICGAILYITISIFHFHVYSVKTEVAIPRLFCMTISRTVLTTQTAWTLFSLTTLSVLASTVPLVWSRWTVKASTPWPSWIHLTIVQWLTSYALTTFVFQSTSGVTVSRIVTGEGMSWTVTPTPALATTGAGSLRLVVPVLFISMVIGILNWFS